MKVVIIGSGNVASVLGGLIKKANHEVVQVIGRDIDKAKALADKLNCDSGVFAKSLVKDAELYLFAITDTSLYHLDQYIQLENKLVVHTAGSVSKDVLKNISGKYGIIYPLQSLVKNATELPEIPLLIDACNSNVLGILQKFAKSLSNNISIVSDEERLKYHVAAVLVSNFTNHLFAMADDFCIKEKVDFEKLYPLIDETINRIKLHPPKSVQTGPAIREDIYTLGKHLQMLSAHPDLKYLYLKLSESILKLHQKKHV